MSLTSILSIARTALTAHQHAITVTGHNIANATTPGYTRQRVPLNAATPLRMPMGVVGTGVATGPTQRVRDQYLDATYRREAGLQGQYSTLRDMLGQVEGVFGEPGGNGIASALDGLWDAFGDLANDAGGATPRSQLRDAATLLVQTMHATDGRLSEIERSARERLGDTVGQVNTLAQQIADLNSRIIATSDRGHGAPDLEDQRDLLVDQLSQLMAVRTVDHGDGTIGVIAGESLLVDGGAAQTLVMRQRPGGGYGVGFAKSEGTFDPGAGSVKALIDLNGTQLPAIRAGLDEVARALVTEVNQLHRTGRSATGLTNIDFFDPTGLSAGSIALDAKILQSTDNIAAGTVGGSGDGQMALRIAALRTTGVASLGGSTIAEAYTGVISAVGGAVRQATQAAAAQDTVVASVGTQRESVNGVSTDEELVELMRQQQAYAAAARLVSVADEMMQDVLRMV